MNKKSKSTINSAFLEDAISKKKKTEKIVAKGWYGFNEFVADASWDERSRDERFYIRVKIVEDK